MSKEIWPEGDIPLLEMTPQDSPEQENKAHDHQKAVEFVNRHRDFFEHYARGQITVEAAPEELDTFATDLRDGKIYVHGRFYKDQGHDLSDEKTAFAVLHELGHLEERMQMLDEPNGATAFARYLGRKKGSEAFSLMDNCVGDIRENRTAISRTSKEVAETEQALYREDLFADTDFTPAPRHVQFCQTLLRESRVPDESCTVAPDVRAKLDELETITSPDGVKLLEAMTDPYTPMSLRLKLQDRYVWPMVKELMDKDLEDRKSQKKGSGKGKGKKGGKPDPNTVFADAYEKTKQNMPHAVSVDDMEKAFKEWKEAQGENALDRADKEYAKNIGVRPEDLKQYRDIVESLERTVNPETNENVVEELRALFNRIIARRLKPMPAPRYPVEEGEELVDPTELYTQVQKGNLEPKAWETSDIKERAGKKFGEIEITLVCDRSDSMNRPEDKLIQQRKAAVLVMEALKEFSEQCDEERVNMDHPLEIRSEVYAFQQSDADTIPLKKMSKELGEKERIDVAVTLSSAPGGTTDFVPLETMHAGIDEETARKIAEGELKKIVIVFTDGDSNDPAKVKNALEKLRGRGVMVIGVGVTKEGRSALTTYAPEARLAEKAEDLPRILGDVLKEYLADV